MDAKLNKAWIGTVSFVFIFAIFLTSSSTLEATANSPEDILVSTPATCPYDMLAYWKLDEESPGLYKDYLGSHDAQCTDRCPSPEIEGILNGAQLFDKDRINVPYNAVFDWDANSDFSLELWVNYDGEFYDQNMIFIGKHGGTADAPAWWLGGGNQAAFSLRDSNKVSHEIYGVTALNDNKWHHIVAVHDGKNHSIQLYVDGKLEVSEPVSFTGHWFISRDISIGYHNIKPYYYFNGKLDEIAIYDRALSSAEIKHHYDNAKLDKDYCEPVTLTINIDGPGTVQKSPNEPYRLGEPVTLEAFPDPGNIFYHWSGDLVSYESPVTISMDKDKSITAKFDAPIYYTLVVDTIGEGSVVVEPLQKEYLHRTLVTLKAVPKLGWGLKGWTGDYTGTANPACFMVTANFKVTATFIKVDSKIYLPQTSK
jgi:hypothetical protein